MTRMQTLLATACAIALSVTASPATYAETVLHSFNGSDGSDPTDGLLRDSAGNFYGTADKGGTNNKGDVFKMAPDGTVTVLHSFGGSGDGAYPVGGLIKDGKGNLYGTTYVGGTANGGIVFKVASDGTETVLYNFLGPNVNDGRYPEGVLVRDKTGNLYGTTSQGGSTDTGTVFKLAKDGTETVLHQFSDGNDGAYPYAGLIFDAQGNLYGTASGGGSKGNGVVFEMAPNGTETVLYNFAGGNDGASPGSGVIMDASGNFYGTTQWGGGGPDSCSGPGGGVVYKLAPNSTEKVLHAFQGGNDGLCSDSGVIMDRNGNLYGTTVGGGSTGYGTVYRVTAKGHESILYNFTNSGDGSDPVGGLIMNKGILYGTAQFGGTSGQGVVFEMAK